MERKTTSIDILVEDKEWIRKTFSDKLFPSDNKKISQVCSLARQQIMDQKVLLND